MTTNSKEYARKYYAEHKEMFRESSRRYQEKKRLEKKLKASNPKLFDMREDYATPTREKFQAIREKELTYSQRYYAENRERIREQQRLSRKRKKINAKQREYYAANREHICEMQRKNRAAKKRQEKLSKTFLGRLYLKVFG
jgi:hypothetical protein